MNIRRVIREINEIHTEEHERLTISAAAEQDGADVAEMGYRLRIVHVHRR